MRLDSKRTLKVMSATLLTAAFVMVSAGTASAGSIAPDWRGDENSVYAHFDWDTFGEPWILSAFETGPSIYPLDDTVPSMTETGIDTHVDLPNFIDPLPMKYMRLTLYMDGPVDSDAIRIEVMGHDPEGATAMEVFRTAGSSQTHYFDWEITPNPDWEQIWIYGDEAANFVPGNFLAMEIDTISIPEPASISLMALGSLMMMRRRR